MLKRWWGMAGILGLCLLFSGPAPAQSPSPEQLAAARELVVTMKLATQLKVLMPVFVNALKAAMLSGRSPEFVRDFEALLPTLMAEMEKHYDEFSDQAAMLYAANFSAQELREVTAFYRSPTGQKLLERQPEITRQSMALGQAWGAKVGEDLKQRMIEGLRKKGYNI
jgi:uncharacterized protein